MLNRFFIYKLLTGAMLFLILFSLASYVSLGGFSFLHARTFSGIVYADTGAPVVGATIMVSGSEGYGYAITNSFGQYSINEGLKTGNYTVSVIAQGYLHEEIENVPVEVGLETSDVDFYLKLSGGISGKITDINSGLPLQNIMIITFNPSNSSFGWSALTDSNGDYRIATNLATGTYNISVAFPEGYVTKMIGDIGVTAGVVTTGVNLALERSGVISGIVTAKPSGLSLGNVTVNAVSDDGKYFGYAQTNATGHYRISSGLGNGTYTVMTIYGFSFNSTDATVVAGEETSGVNFQLMFSPPTPSGIITGKVTDIDDKPVPDALVIAQGSTGFGEDHTDENGEYIISHGLENGTYTGFVQANGHLPENVSGIFVVESQVTPNINFQLSRIPPAQSGIISGTVQGDENPVPEFNLQISILIAITLVVAVVAKTSKAKVKQH